MSDLVSDHKCNPMTNIALFSSLFVCFTQLWNDEAERVQVLAEKHKRGAAARGVRALQKRKRKLVQIGGIIDNHYSPKHEKELACCN